jgi:hypothetical protein
MIKNWRKKPSDKQKGGEMDDVRNANCQNNSQMGIYGGGRGEGGRGEKGEGWRGRTTEEEKEGNMCYTYSI